jgi:phosphoenolpyruvate phosphomutase
VKAMILASGTGSRLAPLTSETAKCLIDINGTNVLGLQLKTLDAAGIREIIITTGAFREKVESFVRIKFPALHVNYVHNERFDSTNYIYSMYKCKDLIDDDFLLMHGDLVFDRELLNSIIKQNCSSVLMNRTFPLPQKDFKGLIHNGLVCKIGINIFGRNAFFLAPLYKLLKEHFQIWMSKIIEFIEADKTTCYAEDAFNALDGAIKLHPFYYDNDFCMELDTIEDLEKIRRVLMI